MNNIVDLNREREINTLIHKLGKLISVDPDVNDKTFDYLLNEDNEMVDTDKTKTVSVRFPIELLKWIDGYSRVVAINEDTRITRNATIIGFLETMKGVIEYQEKNVWGNSHLDEIRKVLESGNQSDNGKEG